MIYLFELKHNRISILRSLVWYLSLRGLITFPLRPSGERKSSAFSRLLGSVRYTSHRFSNYNGYYKAIKEAIEYCENNQELLKSEAEEERRYLEERGVILEPKITHR